MSGEGSDARRQIIEQFSATNEILVSVGLVEREDIFVRRTPLPEVSWTQLPTAQLTMMQRFRYWLGDKLEALAWRLRDGI